MNSTSRLLIATVACALGCAFATPASAQAQFNAPAPAAGYVMMAGHWNQVNGQWQWVAAHWELPPSPGAAYVAGHWVSQAGNWVWVNGAWNVGDPGQAQSAPPTPPNQGALVSGSSLAPATPAPYVDGQDVPDGQAVVTTDYGPLDYAAGYPAYDYPYYWGSPWFYGVGFAGYYGGRGWYGHGGYYGRGGYAHGGYARAGYAHGAPGRGGYAGHAGFAAGHAGGGFHH